MGTQKLTAVVVGSAPGPKADYLLPYLTGGEIVICADGGLGRALEIGLKPDWYVGDNDSGGSAPDGVPHWLLPSEKVLTDLEMGVDKALELGAEEILLCGCTGGRADHYLSNLFLLEQVVLQGKKCIMLDEMNEITYLRPGSYTILNHPAYHYFSLLPSEHIIENLTIRNSKYTLEKTDVQRGSSRTVSNEFDGSMPAEISFTGGGVYLIRSVPESEK